MYDRDISAHKASFAIEANLNIPLEKIDCAVLQHPQRIECMVAKHEISTLSSSLGMLDSIVRLIFVVGLLAGALSIIGFLLAPFYKTDSQKQP